MTSPDISSKICAQKNVDTFPFLFWYNRILFFLADDKSYCYWMLRSNFSALWNGVIVKYFFE